MLWAAPVAVFAAAHLWSYTGREILNVGPDNSLLDRTMAATKLAGAALGVELIGVKVVNVTMSSYGQPTINGPNENVQIPTIEPSLSSDLASDTDPDSNSSSGRAFDLTETIYGYFITILSFRPHVAWFTVYPELMLALVAFALIGLTRRLTGFYLGLRFIDQSLQYAFNQLRHLTKTLRAIGRIAEQATETMEHVNMTLEIVQAENAIFREELWKYTDEISDKTLENQEWQRRSSRDLVEALARLELTTRIIEERSKKPSTDWENALSLENMKQQLVHAFVTLQKWLVEFRREQAKMPTEFANDLVHDTEFIMTVVERAIESAQKLLMREESLATRPQPYQAYRPTSQYLSPLRGPPMYDSDDQSPRTLYRLEKPDPTEIEAQHASKQEGVHWLYNKSAGKTEEQMEMERLTTERERKNPQNEKEKPLEMTRIAIEKREREKEEKEERERTRKAIAEREREKRRKAQIELENEKEEPLEMTRIAIEKREREKEEKEEKEEEKEENENENEGKENEQKENEANKSQAKDNEPKKGAKTKKGAKSKKPQSE